MSKVEYKKKIRNNIWIRQSYLPTTFELPSFKKTGNVLDLLKAFHSVKLLSENRKQIAENSRSLLKYVQSAVYNVVNLNVNLYPDQSELQQNH